MPADSGPAAAEVRRFPRKSPPRPRPRPRPRLRRANRRASSAFLCSCILSCSSAMRARSVSLRRTPFGLNLLVADAPRLEETGAGVLLGNLETDVDGDAATSGTGVGTGAAAGSAAVAGFVSSAAGEVCAPSRAAAAAAAPRAAPPRSRTRPLVVDFGGIVVRLADGVGDGCVSAGFWLVMRQRKESRVLVLHFLTCPTNGDAATGSPWWGTKHCAPLCNVSAGQPA